ncbi:MAG: GNAT family N-acetyltransferase [Spirosomataceae bacterium]
MNLQPTLVSPRTLLTPLLPSDQERLYAVANDPLIWEQHPNPDRWQKPVFQLFFEGALQSQGAFLLLNRKTGEVMGTSRFYGYDPPSSLVFIGYTFLARKFWGTGINSEIKKVMLDYAFESVSQVHFQIGANNLRSQIAIERLGAIKIGEEVVAYHAEQPKLNFLYKLTSNSLIS